MASKPPDLKQIAETLLQEAFQKVIHNTIVQQHRAHKLLLASLDPITKLPHCETCKLPRLLDPPLAPKVRASTTEPSRDTEYCERRPWSRRRGHDIYGNPFPKADATGRPPTKKEREAAKAKNNAPESTPASEEPGQNGTGPPSPSENGEQDNKKLEKGEKKANKIDEKLKKGEYVPWHTCPSCKRSLLITRFAKHLEQCMGLSGRAASRNAMVKMNSTPGGSRAGTPGPNGNSQEGGVGGKASGGGGEDDEDEELPIKGPGSMKKKLLKKTLSNKVKKEKGLAAGVGANGKIPKSLAAAKRPPGNNSQGSNATARASPASSSQPGSKRDREDESEMLLGDEGDDDETVHVKKRQKLTRVGSTASMASQATTTAGAGFGSAGGMGMERQESQDGSFVDADDASAAED